MTIVQVGDGKYINVDRITYVEPGRKGRLEVHFDVGGGDVAGPKCRMTLESDEADILLRWLDARSRES